MDYISDERIETALAHCNKRLAELRFRAQIISRLIDVLPDGLYINKTCEARLKAAFPDETVHYNDKYVTICHKSDNVRPILINISLVGTDGKRFSHAALKIERTNIMQSIARINRELPELRSVAAQYNAAAEYAQKLYSSVSFVLNQ